MGGSVADSRIVTRLTAGQQYSLAACALAKVQGTFRLSVEEGAPPELSPSERDELVQEDLDRRLERLESAQQPNAESRVAALQQVALALTSGGRPEEARSLYERALSVSEEALGPEHPHTAWVLNDIGAFHYSHGDYEAALRHHERALTIREDVLGPEHPETSLSLNNVATTLSAQGRYDVPGGPQLTTTLSYDAEGNLLSLTDANGNSTAYTYNLLGHQVRIDRPLGSYEVTTTDLEGQIVRVEDANANVANNSAGGDYAYGGGIRVRSQTVALLANNTISGNTARGSGPIGSGYEDGGGIVSYYSSNIIIVNAILRDNSPNQIAGPAQVSYSNVQGGAVGPGNIDLDPRFIDPAQGDYRLACDSPCIDAGTGSFFGSWLLDNQDLEGDSRLVDGDSDGNTTIDMGSDEFDYLTLLQGVPLAGGPPVAFAAMSPPAAAG